MTAPPPAHNIDQLWCDVHGVYVCGWVHTGEAPALAVKLSCGDALVEQGTFLDRPDVAAYFANPQLLKTGFSVYLACPPFQPVLLTIVSADGETQVAVKPPPTPPDPPPHPDPAPMDFFVAQMKRRGGTVVEIGARVVGPASTLQAPQFAPECRHVGVDIHAAPGVDIVVDAHHLSRAFEPGSISGVFSLAVMEHLAMPWLVAAQINAVLEEGGLVYHVLPQTFPVHEMPNDFWRMTDEALKVLYGAATGFEVIEAGMLDPVRIYYSPTRRYGAFLQMPLHDGKSTSYIIARKVRTLPTDAVRWPLDDSAVCEQSALYPAHANTDAVESFSLL